MNRLGFAVLFALAAMAESMPPARAQTPPASAQETQSPRPRIIIHPRGRGPNAKRYCRTRLVQEFRVSGTVIVPHTTCWWQ